MTLESSNDKKLNYLCFKLFKNTYICLKNIKIEKNK